jgi:hypothetical protein
MVIKTKYIGVLILLVAFLSCSCTLPSSTIGYASTGDTTTVSSSSQTETTPVTQMSTSTHYSYSHASYAYKVGNLIRLEGYSTVIVLVTAQNGSKEITSSHTPTPDISSGRRPDAYHITPVKVDKVYKTDGKIVEGDTISIEEYYSTLSDPKTGYHFTFIQTFPLPMIPGKQYMLFLMAPEFDGDYSMVRGDMGKYVYSSTTRNATDIKQLSADDLEIGREADGAYVPQEYYDLAAEVIAKYMRDKS